MAKHTRQHRSLARKCVHSWVVIGFNLVRISGLVHEFVSRFLGSRIVKSSLPAEVSSLEKQDGCIS